MSPRGREHFQTLRDLYRRAEWRRFRCKHRTNRYVEILGPAPDGKTMIGFWEGQDDITRFPADDIQWTELTAYI